MLARTGERYVELEVLKNTFGCMHSQTAFRQSSLLTSACHHRREIPVLPTKTAR